MHQEFSCASKRVFYQLRKKWRNKLGVGWGMGEWAFLVFKYKLCIGKILKIPFHPLHPSLNHGTWKSRYSVQHTSKQRNKYQTQRRHEEAGQGALYPERYFHYCVKPTWCPEVQITTMISPNMDLARNEWWIRSSVASVAYYTIYEIVYCIQAKDQPYLHISNVTIKVMFIFS